MNDIRINFGENLKRIRNERKLTQSELAARSGLSVSFLQNIEAGKRWVGHETVSTLASLLQIPENEFFQTQDHLPTPDPKQLLKLFCEAFGIELEIQTLRKMKVNRAHTYYARFYADCPHDIGDLLLELSQHDDWNWESLRTSLSKLKKELF